MRTDHGIGAMGIASLVQAAVLLRDAREGVPTQKSSTKTPDAPLNPPKPS